MKKNLISILILALMVVNVVLTAIMMFSVTSTAKKTGKLVTNIAAALNLELESKEEKPDDSTVAIADSVPYDIEDKLTIPLKKSEDGKSHYCLVKVSFYMNSKHEDYATYSGSIDANLSLIKNAIIDVFGSYTMDEAQGNPEAIKQDILKELQKLYGSTFIYKVAFSDIMYQ